MQYKKGRQPRREKNEEETRTPGSVGDRGNRSNQAGVNTNSRYSGSAQGRKTTQPRRDGTFSANSARDKRDAVTKPFKTRGTSSAETNKNYSQPPANSAAVVSQRRSVSETSRSHRDHNKVTKNPRYTNSSATATSGHPVKAKPKTAAPDVPRGISWNDLDSEIRRELRGLPKALAEEVGKHLVAAGLLIDADPNLALLHARYARSKASRIGIIREAVGLSAYQAGEWAEALAELRAARRMTNDLSHSAVIADCERALGRPERAIELIREVSAQRLSESEQVELAIVAAGARRDMGQLDAAIVSLQGKYLDARRRDPWSARLFYAYADNLAAAGRRDEAIEWFLNAAAVDETGITDAEERAFELSQ